jgi:peptide-methionine (S)-S-oxide reductase
MFRWFVDPKKMRVPNPSEALPGRSSRPFFVHSRHAVLGTTMEGPWPDGSEIAVFGLGCFWGAERLFWQLPGVISTQVGYAGGTTPHPTYQEVCSGGTGHTEVVRVIFDPAQITYADLVRTFFESHDPTQGMRQGNDVGTQYRSAIYTFSDAQRTAAVAARQAYARALAQQGFGAITTEIEPVGDVYLAEDYHQQYLHKNPDGYCGIGGTGVSCPVGVGV